MADKELKDWCKTCNVEPPAMKFKCPECEHNPDKEQIIIDGVDVSGCESAEYHSLNPITLANEFLSTPMCRAYQSKCEGRNCYFKQLARKPR